jgi:hypothetical protein
MEYLLEWLKKKYNAEYDIPHNKVYIKKPMQVGDFIELKKILIKWGVKDIILEEGGKVYGKKI